MRLLFSPLGAVCSLAALLAPMAPLWAAAPEAGTIAAGTRFATPFYLQDSGQPGPTVLVTGGIHGDETAGAAAAEEIRHWTVVRGRLIVVPRLNTTGLAAGRRRMADVDESLADLNRDFPRVGRQEPARGSPAVEIWQVVRQQKPAWLVDLHEAQGVHGSKPGNVGSTLLPCPSPDMTQALPVLLAAVNGAISQRPKQFIAARPPKDSTLARAAGEHLGIRALIVETTRPGQSLEVRVRQHTTIVRALLEHLKMIAPAAEPKPGRAS
jgi:predicted deacylase